MKSVLVTLIEIDKALRDRLYVVQVACESGWKLARNLSAVNQGKFTRHYVSTKQILEANFMNFKECTMMLDFKKPLS